LAGTCATKISDFQRVSHGKTDRLLLLSLAVIAAGRPTAARQSLGQKPKTLEFSRGISHSLPFPWLGAQWSFAEKMLDVLAFLAARQVLALARRRGQQRTRRLAFDDWNKRFDSFAEFRGSRKGFEVL